MQGKPLGRVVSDKRLFMSSLALLRSCQSSQQLYSTRATIQNHYELLGLQKDCTQAEIKESFIRLSKEFHPDTNPDSAGLHQKFVAVNEAYSVLSKPQLRAVYDAELAHRAVPDMRTYGGIRTNAPREKVIFRDESFWENRDRSEDYKYQDQPYYGVRGMNKKLPNSYIAAGAVLFMIVGAIFHFFIAKVSSDFTIEQLNRRDRLASEHLMLVREKARINGTELQMALIRQKSEADNK